MAPWEESQALVTTEREGIRTSKVVHLQGTQPVIEIPVTKSDIPNLFISVHMVKGRTSSPVNPGDEDVGKPDFRLAIAEIKVSPAGQALDIALDTNKKEYKPGEKAVIKGEIRNTSHQRAPAEVTLWAVDYGIVSLTRYRPPDGITAFYPARSQSVVTTDSRQAVLAHRVFGEKGEGEPGGGGAGKNPVDELRKDFRPLAFYLGSVPTNRQGKFTAKVSWPDSLTTWRIFAVAADDQGRYGRAHTDRLVTKDLLAQPALPRFLSLGDTAQCGGLFTNRTAKPLKVKVTASTPNTDLLRLEGATEKALVLKPQEAREVSFLLQGIGGLARPR